MNDQLTVEGKERLQQGLRILGRMIARAHLRSLGYPADGLNGQPDLESPPEDTNDKSSKSTRARDDAQGKREGKNGNHSGKRQG